MCSNMVLRWWRAPPSSCLELAHDLAKNLTNDWIRWTWKEAFKWGCSLLVFFRVLRVTLFYKGTHPDLLPKVVHSTPWIWVVRKRGKGEQKERERSLSTSSYSEPFYWGGQVALEGFNYPSFDSYPTRPLSTKSENWTRYVCSTIEWASLVVVEIGPTVWSKDLFFRWYSISVYLLFSPL